MTEIRCPSCGAILRPHVCGEERQRRFLCPACDGDGKVMRMTDAYAGMVAVANGQPFGWTGETHEWRTCRVCGGTGLLS
jgi:hypothetical protein